MLEPIFAAKSIKNQAFLTVYYRILRDELTPLLKNHLIPRVQAMIILGECGSADFLPLYFAQIKDPNQTVWVKLWALEGMVNVIEDGGRLTAQDQILAAKTVAEFLEKEADLPWPAQLRALEVLSAMRQGYEPNKPQKATMANAAMTLLADGAAKLEVRSEAARALGQMPIASAVSKYNYPLVAHAAGQLAAELGNRIATGFSTNQDKAKYLTALLIGPVYQAFDGVPGARDSGLLHATGGPSAAYVQKVFDLVKPVAQATIELLSAGQRQVKNRQKELVAHVAALKDFLEKNAPGDRHLVPDGAEFPIALLPDVGLAPAAAPLAKQRKQPLNSDALAVLGPTRFSPADFQTRQGMFDKRRLAFVAPLDRAGLADLRVVGLFRRARPRANARHPGQGGRQAGSITRLGRLDRVYSGGRDRRQAPFRQDTQRRVVRSRARAGGRQLDSTGERSAGLARRRTTVRIVSFTHTPYHPGRVHSSHS